MNKNENILPIENIENFLNYIGAYGYRDFFGNIIDVGDLIVIFESARKSRNSLWSNY